MRRQADCCRARFAAIHFKRDNMRILVGNLPDDVTQDGIREALSAFAPVEAITLFNESGTPTALIELEKRTKARLNPEPFLLRKAGQLFYNTSPLDLNKLMGDQDHVGENLRAYVQAFSPNVRRIP